MTLHRPTDRRNAPRPPRARRIAALRAGIALALATGAAGCSSWFGGAQTAYAPRVGDTPNYATSSIPQNAAAAYPVETGVAAWNGDISAGGLTAAHAALPTRSWARVTNVATGRTTTVRITERLAPGSGRTLELSRDAAAAVGALHNGLVTVLIEPLDPRQTTPQDREWVRVAPPAPAPAPARAAPQRSAPPASGIAYDPNLATGSIPDVGRAAPAPRANRSLAAQAAGAEYLQLGAFKDSKNAHRLLTRMGAEGMTEGAYGDGFIETAYVDGEIWHRVRLGPLESDGEARRALKDAQALGHTSARLVRP